MSSFFGSSLCLGFLGFCFSSFVADDDGLPSVKIVRHVYFCFAFREG